MKNLHKVPALFPFFVASIAGFVFLACGMLYSTYVRAYPIDLIFSMAFGWIYIGSLILSLIWSYAEKIGAFGCVLLKRLGYGAVLSFLIGIVVTIVGVARSERVSSSSDYILDCCVEKHSDRV